MTDQKDSGYTIKSVKKAIELLNLFKRNQPELSHENTKAYCLPTDSYS